MKSKKLRIVCLESPIDCWEEPWVQKIFCQLVEMKRDGYTHKYNERNQEVLPLDGTDFCGNHLMVCIGEEDQLEPILAYKSITYSQCKRFNLTFPAISAAIATKSSLHVEGVTRFVNSKISEGKNVAYENSFTLSPKIKENLELELEVHKLFYCMAIKNLFSNGIDYNIMLAHLNFKTDKTFKKLGCQPISYQEKELDVIQIASLGYSDLQFVYSDLDIPKRAMMIADQYKEFWTNRIILSADRLMENKRAA